MIKKKPDQENKPSKYLSEALKAWDQSQMVTILSPERGQLPSFCQGVLMNHFQLPTNMRFTEGKAPADYALPPKPAFIIVRPEAVPQDEWDVYFSSWTFLSNMALALSDDIEERLTREDLIPLYKKTRKVLMKALQDIGKVLDKTDSTYSKQLIINGLCEEMSDTLVKPSHFNVLEYLAKTAEETLSDNDTVPPVIDNFKISKRSNVAARDAAVQGLAEAYYLCFGTTPPTTKSSAFETHVKHMLKSASIIPEEDDPDDVGDETLNRCVRQAVDFVKERYQLRPQS